MMPKSTSDCLLCNHAAEILGQQINLAAGKIGCINQWEKATIDGKLITNRGTGIGQYLRELRASAHII